MSEVGIEICRSEDSTKSGRHATIRIGRSRHTVLSTSSLHLLLGGVVCCSVSRGTRYLKIMPNGSCIVEESETSKGGPSPASGIAVSERVRAEPTGATRQNQSPSCPTLPNRSDRPNLALETPPGFSVRGDHRIPGRREPSNVQHPLHEILRLAISVDTLQLLQSLCVENMETDVGALHGRAGLGSRCPSEFEYVRKRARRCRTISSER